MTKRDGIQRCCLASLAFIRQIIAAALANTTKHKACTTQLNPNCSQTATRPAITASDPALKRHNHSDPPSCAASAVVLAPSGRTAGTAACCRRRCAGGTPSLLTKRNGMNGSARNVSSRPPDDRAHDGDSPPPPRWLLGRRSGHRAYGGLETNAIIGSGAPPGEWRSLWAGSMWLLHAYTGHRGSAFALVCDD